MNRAAYGFAVAVGFVGYYVARAMLRQLDVESWRRAWEQVPEPRRQAIRNTLLTEEGVRPNGD